MSFNSELYNKILSFENLTALSLGKKKVLYKELNNTSLKISTLLSQIKSNEDVVVGILGQRNVSVYFGILGSVYAGCTYVPINIKYTEDTILKIIRTANINVLVVDSQTFVDFEDIIKTSEVTHVLIPDNVNENNYNEIKIYDEKEIIRREISKPIQVDQKQIIYILFTSGSTGEPKGVKISFENIEYFIKNTNKFYNIQPGSKFSQAFDLSFDASVIDIYLTFLNGGELCILENSEVIMPYDYIIREKLNFWYSVPTLGNLMLRLGYLKKNSFPDLKYSLFGGEPMSKELADAWKLAAPNSTVENVYGPTEATVNITRFKYTEEYCHNEFKNNILPIGKTFNHHQFAIVDNDLKKLGINQVGQLIFKGPQISLGYLKDEIKTMSVFKLMKWDTEGDLWYLTGDLAFINSDGLIECLGRIDNQIKLAGRRIELGEIESTLLKSKYIDEIVVVAKRKEDKTVESLIAFTTSDLDDKQMQEIQTQFITFLEDLFFPKEFIKLSFMPLMSSGKTDRKQLSNMANSKK